MRPSHNQHCQHAGQFEEQITDLVAVSSRTTQWMQELQARSVEIDKTLADLREDIAALQAASVSSVETTSAGSEWPLPMFAGSAVSVSHGRPSQILPPGEVRAFLGKNTRPPDFLPAPAPEAWHQLDDEFQRSAVLVGFSFGRNKDAVKKKFWDESFPQAGLAFDILCKNSQ